MPKKTYKDIPPNYPVCGHADCPMVATCLHQLAYGPLKQKDTILHLLNPDLCSRNESCRFYRSNAPVVYARGFTNFQQRMYPGQYQAFMHKLIGKFGRNSYFERRRGDTALSPKEQQWVLSVLKDVGIQEAMKFDSYEENTSWYD